jgi:hypothetical protein
MMDPTAGLLRHLLATIAYRADKAINDAPPGFSDYQIFGGTRSPGQLLAHIGDLLEWSCTLASGQPEWRESAPLVWDQEIRRFYSCLRKLDAHFADGREVNCPIDRLLQGPMADALTHVGQLVMLRRIAGSPVRAENYFKARIDANILEPK